MEFNFDGVQAAKDGAFTQPGTRGIFTIAEVKFDKSKEKQTDFMELTFKAKEVIDEATGKLVPEESGFRHSFYMTSGALQRVQYLAVVLFDEELKGALTGTALTAKFAGKDVALKVSGQVSNKGKGYPDLSFAGFAKKASEFRNDPNILTFNKTEKDLVADALEAIKLSRSSNADSEGAAAPAPGASDKPF